LGNVIANIRLSRYLNLNVSCHIEDGFRRDVSDTRDDMAGYAVVNTTLIAKNFLKGYENLEVRDQSIISLIRTTQHLKPLVFLTTCPAGEEFYY